MKRPELIIFDLDGTLLDTLESIATSYNKALISCGYPPHPVEDFLTIIGDGSRIAAQRCLPKDRQKESEIVRCVELFQQNYALLWHTATPYQGIEKLLAELRPEQKLAVLSNKRNDYTKLCIEHFFPNVFQKVLGHGPKIRHKPEPDGANKLVSDLKASKKSTWLVGDTATDMKTASASGIIGIGALWGFREKSELLSSGAKKVVSRPLQLLELLN